MIPEWEKKADKAIRRLKWKFKLLKIKWGLLFVLPLLIIVLAYEAAKQYLKIRLRRWQVEAPGSEKPEPEADASHQAAAPSQASRTDS